MIFLRLRQGRQIELPNIGMETVHHVHAGDVAQCFVKAIERRSAALGEAFHVVSPAALTLRGYAERVSEWLGIPADCSSYLGKSGGRESPRGSSVTWDQIAHSPNCSIAKARSLLGYEPRYSSLEAVRESVDWLIEHGVVSP